MKYRIHVWHEGTEVLKPESIKFIITIDPDIYSDDCDIGQFLCDSYGALFSKVWGTYVNCNSVPIH